MPPNEIQLLISGIGIGAQGMAVIGMVGDMRQARRDKKRSRAARRRAAAAMYLNSLRLYRLEQRAEARR